MPDHPTTSHSSRAALAVLGAAAAGAAAVYLSWPERGSPASRSRHDLIAYLLDHLSGSDVGVRVVRKLSVTSRNSSDRELFSRLTGEFEDERAAIRALLARLGSSSGSSMKRAAGIVSGVATGLAAGGDPGDLSLFRTLEALTTAVQGKRCLWRALQAVGTLPSPHRLTFVQLEAQAVRQWEALDERRRALAQRTFAAAGGGPFPFPH